MREPATPSIKSVLVLGSGPIVIGQAAEFDYAGTQGVPRSPRGGRPYDPHQFQPSDDHDRRGVADAIYIEPLTPEVVKRVIQRERPDGLLPTLGGQTGLNLAVQVADRGTLERYGVACSVRHSRQSNRQKTARCFETF